VGRVTGQPPHRRYTARGCQCTDLPRLANGFPTLCWGVNYPLSNCSVADTHVVPRSFSLASQAEDKATSLHSSGASSNRGTHDAFFLPLSPQAAKKQKVKKLIVHSRATKGTSRSEEDKQRPRHIYSG
jgi:hypothetical protein